MKRIVGSLAVLVGVGMISTGYGQSRAYRATARATVSDSLYYTQADAEASPSDAPDRPAAPEYDPRMAPEEPPLAMERFYELEAEAAEVEPWHLFSQDRTFHLYGWLAAGVALNPDNPASRYNGPESFDDRNDVQMNQLYAVFEKPAKEGEYCWDVGARVDLLFGSDYIFTQSAGLETRTDFSPKWNTNPHYGLSMPQLYADFTYNNLSIRLGHFYTIIGYEVVTAPDNFFYSHAYTMQYGEPFTHTGGRANYKLNDRWTVVGGIVNGWDKFEAVTNRAAFLGGATYTPEHERYSLAFSLITGDEDGVAPPIVGNRTMYSLVFSFDVTERLQYVFEHDNGWQENGVAPGEAAHWYGVNQYLFYTLNDCWKAGVRGEWFRDNDGTRVLGVRPGNPYGGGSAGNFYAISLGLNWTQHPNLTVRPEVRWDWFDGEGTLPYDDTTKDSQFLAALDVIFTW